MQAYGLSVGACCWEDRALTEKYGHFPPAYVADANGMPIHSWRVVLLEFLDPALFRQYDFDEPWNGPHNSKLAGRMPACYACPDGRDPSRATSASYVAIVGPESAFPGPRPTTISDVLDGLSGTLMVAELANGDVPWMEPRDLDMDRMSFRINDPSRPSISGGDHGGACVLMADGQARHFSAALSPETLKALMTISGPQVLGPDSY